jgi:hypothetical protein
MVKEMDGKNILYNMFVSQNSGTPTVGALKNSG